MNDDIESAVYNLSIASTAASTYLSSHTPTPSETIDISSLYTNYATSLSLLPNLSSALIFYEKSLSLNPTSLDTQYYLALTYQDLSKFSLAISGYLKIIKLDPLHWESLSNLSSLHYDLKHYEKAILSYESSIDLFLTTTPPTNPPGDVKGVLSDLYYRYGLSIIYFNDDFKDGECIRENQKVNCDDLARYAFSRSLDLRFNVESEHYLNTLTEGVEIEKVGNEYVKKLFDDYALNFEESLKDDLGYKGFKIMREFFEEIVVGGGGKDVVDLGCGTGLVGEEFKGISKSLACIDLSLKIIERCKELRPKLYDEYIQGDFLEGLIEGDVYVAGDSFIYFGDLKPLFKRMFEKLREEGYVVFTLERGGGKTWKLTRSGRFEHAESYVLQSLEEVGFEVLGYKRMDGFRIERGKDVKGNVYVARKAKTKSSKGRRGEF
ncbi:hypothetical protein TrLO_g8705 [Triparma laevis f. longispina]|uniref:Methyltransferase type 11 domain-containing protein n=1 Tax=Triparma laevis f. longispina TaxID=1714387 RepID=A0A9W6ZIP6_9STRA|nr:hypothetical protein TrLO_g8705 [Triparma laevis f. longispina]